MNKFLFLLTVALASMGVDAISAETMKEKANILVVTAHPDDAEGIAGGTLMMLKDSFQINIVIASRGERGLSDDPSEETAQIRVKEASSAADYLGANLFFLGQVDGEIYADKNAVDSLVKIMNMLDPQIVITMWAIDVPDHLAVHDMTVKALWQTGLIHNCEVYFGQADHGTQTNQFEPDFLVNISNAAEDKAKLLRFHACQNLDDAMVDLTMEANQYWGLLARTEYAEPFRVYYPLTNSRWKRPAKNTLLKLRADQGQLIEKEAKPNLLIVEAHPGDWEDGIGGTIWMLKDQYKINIVCASRGEMGGGVSEPSVENGRIRTAEARKAADMLDADLFFLGQTDMSVYADQYACDSLAKIARLLNPEIVFTMWGIDVPDHSASFEMAIKALYETKHLHSAEIYFYESDMGGQTNGFEPKIYVDISDVMEEKLNLLRCHEFENPDNILDKNTISKATFHGYLARCKYAEGFMSYYPLVNSRWNNQMKHSLLDLSPAK